MAELFLDGKRLFSLSNLLKYKSREFDVIKEIKGIENEDLQNMILRMIDTDPNQRPTAMECLESPIFIKSLQSFVFPYFCVVYDLMMKQDCDEIVEKMYADYDKIIFFLAEEGPEIEITGLCIPNSCNSVRKSDWLIIIAQLLCSISRCLIKESTISLYLELLFACAIAIDDCEKLDRILPYFLYISQTSSTMIEHTCIEYVTQLVIQIPYC